MVHDEALSKNTRGIITKLFSYKMQQKIVIKCVTVFLLQNGAVLLRNETIISFAIDISVLV